MKNIIGANARHLSTAAPVAAKFLTVDGESDGQRLDNFLMRHLKGVPKTHVYRIIRSGEVRINKGRVSADSRVRAGDVVRVPPLRLPQRPAADTMPDAPAREFPTLIDDEALLAVNKPAGVAVHGGSGVSFGVIEQLRRARPQARFLELVHRLDRETSGILLVAKKRSALTALQDQFRHRETGKTYLALVLGAWPESRKVIDTPLRKFLLPAAGGQDGERRVCTTRRDDPEGMKAVSLVRVARRIPHPLGEMTLLEVTIKTGRTHQIRVHLASEGHPIAGDEKYGDFERNKALQKAGLRRMFLHAWRLRFTHPVTGESVSLEQPPEEALQRFLESSRAS